MCRGGVGLRSAPLVFRDVICLRRIWKLFSFESDAHEPSVVVLFGLVYAANAVIGPGKFHVRGVFIVRGIGAVQALFLTP